MPKRHVGTVGSFLTISLRCKSYKYYPKDMDHPYECYQYLFKDRDGNVIKWWTSKKWPFVEDKWYEVTAKIKSHEYSLNSDSPVTYITTKSSKHISIKLIS